MYRALCLAEECLAALSPSVGRSGIEDEARRILGRARTDLEFCHTHELLKDLPARLNEVQMACSAAHGAISERYFRYSRAVEWSV